MGRGGDGRVPWQFRYCARRRGGAPLVYASHNLEAEKFASYAAAAGVRVEGNRRLRAIEAIEARAAREAELVVAVTDADGRAFAERYGTDPSRVIVIPNGADTARYRPVDAETRRAARRSLGLPDRPVAMFAGSRISPNRHGLDWVRRLAERDRRFTFLVVGAVAPRGWMGENLVCTGFVDDFPSYLRAADLALCPIEYGAGTKIKLLESLAAGLPVVAFAEADRGPGGARRRAGARRREGRRRRSHARWTGSPRTPPWRSAWARAGAPTCASTTTGTASRPTSRPRWSGWPASPRWRPRPAPSRSRRAGSSEGASTYSPGLCAAPPRGPRPSTVTAN